LDKKRVVGIDLGLNNIVTVVNNAGLKPFVIKGGVVKFINQFYNKQLAKYKSIKDKQG
jgi:putative transposase